MKEPYGPLEEVPVGNEMVVAPIGHPLFVAACRGPKALAEYRKAQMSPREDVGRGGMANGAAPLGGRAASPSTEDTE